MSLMGFSLLGCLDVGTLGRWDVWTFGRLEVWMLGRRGFGGSVFLPGELAGTG